jgi:hypothetical protein
LKTPQLTMECCLGILLTERCLGRHAPHNSQTRCVTTKQLGTVSSIEYGPGL